MLLVAIRPENCVKKLLKGIHLDLNMFLITTEPKKCMKNLVIDIHTY